MLRNNFSLVDATITCSRASAQEKSTANKPQDALPLSALSLAALHNRHECFSILLRSPLQRISTATLGPILVQLSEDGNVEMLDRALGFLVGCGNFETNPKVTAGVRLLGFLRGFGGVDSAVVSGQNDSLVRNSILTTFH